MRRGIPVPLMVLLVSLMGCSNRVISNEPWFHEEPSQTRPRIRDGVWITTEPHCKVDESEPAERWPACAHWSYQRGGQSLSVPWNEDGRGRHRRRAYGAWNATESLVVSGEPMISQDTECPLTPKEAPVDNMPMAASGAAPSPPPAEPTPVESRRPAAFCYGGARATAVDIEGRITAFEAWPVFCGPWPRKDGKVTDHPWAGIVLVDDNCNATSEAALREAARRSRDVAVAVEIIGRSQWVRDGWH
jgi:hypothetical protein